MLSFKLMYLNLKIICNRLHSCENNNWEVNSNYLVIKSKFNKFLIETPFIARRKGIKRKHNKLYLINKLVL